MEFIAARCRVMNAKKAMNSAGCTCSWIEFIAYGNPLRTLWFRRLLKARCLKEVDDTKRFEICPLRKLDFFITRYHEQILG
ncbi:hypothetical protein [Priestia koreensis]|uniref:hypothetical protein n=1 Tax=Priestia koreensis TaxID=284581 RepID=UPI00203D9B1A|nr:hypothetical protein [Priestia koreensis]MCM3005787.1 hypothetical protein [Priestia koreensis]